ncbi:MAG TPA: alkaline phosphatase family protein [Solirubrobacteraceae bacterium]|jgi:phospholipase C|nr:alkaline phosphatase family protein [Solirubrobacteraceae bacterium]
MAVDASLERLKQIKHIVVLMMENRSFDQMLGYLKLDGMPDVAGLDRTESNPDADGAPIEVFEWGPEETVFHPLQDTTGKILDPCHSEECVQQQLKDDNKGFVRNFISSRRDKQGNYVAIPPEYRRLPMGYYAAQHLPTYDLLARAFCVCDAWHSSIPGDTWPNRLYAMAGRTGPHTLPPLLERIAEAVKHEFPQLANAPIFDVETFTHHLTEEQWRWYSHDPATLRAADGHYRRFDDADRGNFSFFDRQRVSLITRLLEEPIVSPESFLDDAATGKLRDVSWIDPNFIDLKVLDPGSNDDHPPSDIRAGQSLVLEVYEALRNSPSWQDTLLVVLYDEHGGFYDHVVPPPVRVKDGSSHATYGVRVPAIIVSPRVPAQVCHELFDHPTLIKTILLRFAAHPEQAIAKMGPRVADAAHLGVVLADAPRSDTPDPAPAREIIDEWRLNASAARRGDPRQGQSVAPDGAGRELTLHEFQEDFLRFALAMRHAGLPAGEP